MNKKKENTDRTVQIIAMCGFIALSVGTFNNIVFGTDCDPFTKSFLYPYTNYIVPAVNGGSALAALILFLYPSNIWLMALIASVEATLDVFTGFCTLGVFVYAYCYVVLFCMGYGQKHFKRKAYLVLSYWALVLLSIPFTYGMSDFLFGIGLSIFAASTYISLYRLLRDKLNFLIQAEATPQKSTENNLPPKGSYLNLDKLNITDRQRKCIKYTMESTKSYKEIAQELYISESAIKKDMLELYKKFGVKNREMLRLTLFQYKIIL